MLNKSAAVLNLEHRLDSEKSITRTEFVLFCINIYKWGEKNKDFNSIHIKNSFLKEQMLFNAKYNFMLRLCHH